MNRPSLSLPLPLALTRATDTLTPLGVGSPVYEPKWDGYRALVAGGRIWSRRGTDLTRYFPDLVAALTTMLPDGAAVDGEVVVWDAEAGRLDFAALQARLTAGKNLANVVRDRPAHLVAFDLLADDGTDLRSLPLAERRHRLERLLASVSSPIELCLQTDDRAVAAEWLDTLAAAGIEGVVIKDGGKPYPTKEGQRIWWKLKARRTVDLIAIGFVGDPKQPTTLALAMPSPDAEYETAGSTTVLSKTAALEIAPFLQATGETFERRFVWGSADSVVVHQIRPLVVEVSADAADAAIEAGVLRHGARLLRARPDLEPADVVW